MADVSKNRLITLKNLAKDCGLSDEQMLIFLVSNGFQILPFDGERAIRVEDSKKVYELLETNFVQSSHTNTTNIRRIKIQGLFGYKNVDIRLENDVNIWVSENGYGKTTILRLIVAVLSGDRKTIQEINFESVTVYFENERITFNKPINSEKYKEQIADIIFELRTILPTKIYARIIDVFNSIDENDVSAIDYLKEMIYEEIMRIGLPSPQTDYILYELRTINNSKKENYGLAKKNLWQPLNDIKNKVNQDIIFYPTYRRIETSFEIFDNKNRSRNIVGSSRYLKFGMSDVRDIIDSLLKKMGDDAVQEYRSMNGTIINDLLDGKELPSGPVNLHKLDVVIKRIGQKEIKNIDKLKEFIGSSHITEKDKFLIYILNKLISIYDTQMKIDEKLSRFAEICTKYMENKRMIYDEAMLTMKVYNKYEEVIDYENLSSGEKQIVSIFAKIYLDTAVPSIFIIDEPELSLSIKWQQTFLEDIYASGKVKLLIATTHSPFIFKNEYRKFAVDLFREEV